MDFYIIWLTTIVLSSVMDYIQELRLYKDLADSGYKINLDRLSELQKQIDPNGVKIAILQMLTPVLNILQVLLNAANYSIHRDEILFELAYVEALEEMTEKEKKEYAKKPTMFNAFLIPIKSEIESLREQKNDDNKINEEKNKTENDSLLENEANIIKLKSEPGDSKPKNKGNNRERNKRQIEKLLQLKKAVLLLEEKKQIEEKEEQAPTKILKKNKDK